MPQIQVRTIAYSRSGDKGDLSNIVVAPFDEGDYEWLGRHLTVDVVREHFELLVKGSINRYEMPGTRMYNFVMEKALQGGVARSINIDMHGKSRASLMLSIELEAKPDDLPPSMEKASRPAAAASPMVGR